MSESWYVRSSDGDRGPFEFTELLGLIRSDSLGGEDEVKCSLDGHWIKVNTIDLQAAEGTGNLDSLVKVKNPSRPKSSEGSSRPQPSRLVLIWEEIYDRTNPRFVWPIVIVAVWLGANYLVTRIINPYATERGFQTRLVEIRDQLAQLEAAKTEGSAWEDFAIPARAEVTRIAGKLESGATAEHPVRRHLFWAARDCLLPGLKEPKAFTPEQQQRFDRYMSQVNTALSRQGVGF